MRGAIVRTRDSNTRRRIEKRKVLPDALEMPGRRYTAADLESVNAPRRRENNARGGSGAESSRMGML